MKKAIHADIKSVRKSERKIRRAKRLVALLIVLFVGITIYATYPVWLPKLEGIFDKPVKTISNDGKTEKGNFPIEPDDPAARIYAVRNNLMTADAHNLIFYDENGKKKNSFAHEFSNPVVRAKGKRALVFDSGSKGFKLFNKGGEIYSKTAENTILTGSVGEDGTAAIITSSDKYPSAMRIYSKDGKLIYRYNCIQRIMAAAVDSDGRGCYVLTFTSENGEIFSQVRRLDFSKKGEQMVSDNLPCLAIDCVYNNAGHIVVSGDSGMYTVSKEGEIISSYEYEGELVDFALDEGCCAALVSGSTKNSGKLIIAQAEAKESESYRVIASDSTSGSVRINGDRVLMLGSRNVSAYTFTATLAATADLKREYTDFVYINSAVYLCGKHGIDKITFDM